jgi:hypothetical protein
MREADARPEGANAKCCVLQPSTGLERWTTGCGCVIIRTSHGATTAREIGSITAARGDRSAAQRAVGRVAGPGSAQTGRRHGRGCAELGSEASRGAIQATITTYDGNPLMSSARAQGMRTGGLKLGSRHDLEEVSGRRATEFILSEKQNRDDKYF